MFKILLLVIFGSIPLCLYGGNCDTRVGHLKTTDNSLESRDVIELNNDNPCLEGFRLLKKNNYLVCDSAPNPKYTYYNPCPNGFHALFNNKNLVCLPNKSRFNDFLRVLGLLSIVKIIIF